MSALEPGREFGTQNTLVYVMDLIFRSFAPAPIKVSRAHVPPDSRCCERNETKSRCECELCGRPVCLRCRRLYNGEWICVPCRDHLKAILDAERAGPGDVPFALAGGLAAGSAGAYLISLTALVSGYLWLLLSVGLGILAGLGAYYGSRRKRGGAVQLAAVLAAFLSVLLTAFLAFFWAVNEQRAASGGAALTPWDWRVLLSFGWAIWGVPGIVLALPTALAMGIASLVPQPRIADVR
jgi:hypothetical protein